MFGTDKESVYQYLCRSAGIGADSVCRVYFFGIDVDSIGGKHMKKIYKIVLLTIISILCIIINTYFEEYKMVGILGMYLFCVIALLVKDKK